VIKAALLAACLAAVAGCADVKPMQDQIDELKAKLDQLQKDNKAAEASAKAASANASVAGMQKALRQAQAANQSNANAIAALSERIDQMFKRPLAKQAAAEH
jgi:hypothetical protein